MEKAQKSHLVFQLNKEAFAFNVSHIQSIVEVPQITTVPQMPDYFEGIIKFNGEAVPVINTRIKFGMPKSEFNQNTCIIILQVNSPKGEMNLGALVDSVDEVMEVDEEEILESPTTGKQYDTQFIKGLVKSDTGFIMVLNADEIFNAEQIELMAAELT